MSAKIILKISLSFVSSLTIKQRKHLGLHIFNYLFKKFEIDYLNQLQDHISYVLEIILVNWKICILNLSKNWF